MAALKIFIVLPAYNAEKTLLKTYTAIPKSFRKNILVVDDASQDKTVTIAQKQKLPVIVHPQNRGYGANQKTCYTWALSQGADIIVMLHPDFQYDPTRIPDLVQPIIQNKCDIMLGSRITTWTAAKAGHMPYYKYICNRLLTITQNFFLNKQLSEYHTGFRAFSSHTLRRLPFHRYSDNFVFDQQILYGAVGLKARIGEIPVPVKYFSDASSISLKDSMVYGVSTLTNLLIFVFNSRFFL